MMFGGWDEPRGSLGRPVGGVLRAPRGHGRHDGPPGERRPDHRRPLGLPPDCGLTPALFSGSLRLSFNKIFHCTRVQNLLNLSYQCLASFASHDTHTSPEHRNTTQKNITQTLTYSHSLTYSLTQRYTKNTHTPPHDTHIFPGTHFQAS